MGKKRAIVEFDDDRLLEIRKMTAACGLADISAFINEAVSLQKWAIEEWKNGRDVGSFKTGENGTLTVSSKPQAFIQKKPHLRLIKPE